jgi:hypothetical protein
MKGDLPYIYHMLLCSVKLEICHTPKLLVVFLNKIVLTKELIRVD